ncbi:hypothetical protein P3X46_012944 [Hevea brasiliensis]|uniref:Uncharacterized protein n=1 Tax=Hevea brasiliensis TaxID=3981 RepID=A0ABQ9MBU0_HEVBR|nr:protein NODULATION SIGNALING PATHWAY 2-like [Hevea brasiliensis]KAJ9177767.1 hypothetical protein P3X46_012944 [Hevea brasiliensis]
MEYEQFHGPLEPSYIEEMHQCSPETFLSFQAEDPITIIQDRVVFYPNCIGRLLEIEKDLMDISSMNQDSIMDLESFLYMSELSRHMNQETQENMSKLREENSMLKGIQEELMEEGNLADLLLMGAEDVEAQNWTFSSTIILKLRDLLFEGENEGNSFNRLALFFTQGLHYRSIITNTSEKMHELGFKQTVDSISAFHVMQELSPYAKFAHFTANQAILEATQGDQEIHIIDFDILEGIQWPPLMADLAMRKNHASLKLTAMISDQQDAAAIQQTVRRLKGYADSINFSFVFEQMVMVNEDYFLSIEVGYALVANCMIHQLYMPDRCFSLVKTFLEGMSRLSPKLVVLVQEELFNFAKIPSMSFVEFFREALHHYTALSDSLVNSFSGGYYNTELKLIEKEFLGIRFLESVCKFPCEKKEKLLWRDGFASLKGFKPIPLSSYNVSQANLLVSLFNGGYRVQHEKCRLALYWKSRPLTSASIWVPIPKSR